MTGRELMPARRLPCASCGEPETVLAVLIHEFGSGRLKRYALCELCGVHAVPTCIDCGRRGGMCEDLDACRRQLQVRRLGSVRAE